ncbi:MAG: hypothetical protein R3B72_13280 [Polyangiaceae bacterium]
MRYLFLLLTTAGCALASPIDDPTEGAKDERGHQASRSHALETCEMALPSETLTLEASAFGVALATPTEDGRALVQRYQGIGCDLDPVGLPIASHGLLGFDDAGQAYVFPAPAEGPGVVATDGEAIAGPESLVARVALSGEVETVVTARRGIWGFGVSPEGSTIWVDSCGPTGIFALTPTGLAPSIPTPDQAWLSAPHALTGADRFWSLEAESLQRASRAGQVEVASTADGGHQSGDIRVARCGDRACTWDARSVARWSDDGELDARIELDDATTRIRQVAGDDVGIYLLLVDEAGARLRFVPTEG